ncbi:MAG TPA: tetratricopeptide repeat protein [Gemmatimonadales bacterium]|nr:tetratricopeptide repeat protein [Gemmatimonadales bacterium]
MRVSVAVLMLSGLVTATATAQGTSVSERVALGMRTVEPRYEAAGCSADKDLHYKSSSGRTYLSSAIGTDIEGNRTRLLEDGRRVLTEAITQNNQDQSGGAWFYLGRIYLHQGDVAGADTALARAATLAPDCAEQIDRLRRGAWFALVKPGTDYMEAEQTDSAAALFRAANTIYKGEPNAFVYLAGIAYDAGDLPTALAYFDSALATPADTASAAARDQAMFNKAVVLLRMERAPEAVPVLQEFTSLHPDDVNAMRALMNAYVATGQRDSSEAVAKRLEAMGEAVERTAVAENTPFNRAVTAYNAQQWAEAIAAAEEVVATAPLSHDALYMLARSNFELKKGGEVVKWASQLLAMDPMNENGLIMLGRGYNLTGNSDKAVETRLRLNRMPFGVSQAKLTSTETGATFTATATGRKATDERAAAIAPAAKTLVVEMLDAGGTVVATVQAPVPALADGATHEISVTGQGAGIVAWRYHE